jgi:hypothetical protein
MILQKANMAQIATGARARMALRPAQVGRGAKMCDAGGRCGRRGIGDPVRDPA